MATKKITVGRIHIYDEIETERERQDDQWGGPAHDDEHEETDWLRFIREHLLVIGQRTFRRQMLRVAALAVAAIEANDRENMRHLRGGRADGV